MHISSTTDPSKNFTSIPLENKSQGLNRGSEGDYTHYFLFSQKWYCQSLLFCKKKQSTGFKCKFLFNLYLTISIVTILSILLVLRMEVVDRVRHDVSGVHRFPKRRGDAVHGHAPTNIVSSDHTGAPALCHVHGHGKRIPKCHGREEHFNANEEILISCTDCPWPEKSKF